MLFQALGEATENTLLSIRLFMRGVFKRYWCSERSKWTRLHKFADWLFARTLSYASKQVVLILSYYKIGNITNKEVVNIVILPYVVKKKIINSRILPSYAQLTMSTC